MNLFNILCVICFFVWIWYQSVSKQSVWNEMIQMRPSLQRIPEVLPHYYNDFKLALIEAETLQSNLLQTPLLHKQYPYEKVKDAWQEVIRIWESMAVAPESNFLQADIAAGARMLASQTMRRLEEIQLYDRSPYRTTWLGTGQPYDPYDTNTVTFV